MEQKNKKIIIVGAGVFGVSTAYHLAKSGYKDITLMDKQPYETNFYESAENTADAASSDLSKIIRFSHYNKDYQELAMDAIVEWDKWNESISKSDDLPQGLDNDPIYVKSGYARYYTEDFTRNAEEVENSKSFKRVGLEDTQYDLNNERDRYRAKFSGHSHRLDPLKLYKKKDIKGDEIKAHLDITAGFAYASRATYYCLYLAKKLGVKTVFGPQTGSFKEFIKVGKKVKGLVTMDGKLHPADLVIVACGAWSPKIVPELQGINQATSGNILIIKIPEERKDLIEKYSVKNFPVVAWESYEKKDDVGGVFFFPLIQPGNYLKFGARLTRYTNPKKVNNKVISVPITESEDPAGAKIPADAISTVSMFIKRYMPDIAHLPFHKVRMCWYSETINDDFLIDWVPDNEGLFVCGGSSEHGFKFLPTIGLFAVERLNGANGRFNKRFAWKKASTKDSKLFESNLKSLNISDIELKSKI